MSAIDATPPAPVITSETPVGVEQVGATVSRPEFWQAVCVPAKVGAATLLLTVTVIVVGIGLVHRNSLVQFTVKENVPTVAVFTVNELTDAVTDEPATGFTLKLLFDELAVPDVPPTVPVIVGQPVTVTDNGEFWQRAIEPEPPAVIGEPTLGVKPALAGNGRTITVTVVVELWHVGVTH